MSQALQKAGIDVVVLGPEQSKHGAVETYEEAKRCAELFKSKAHAIDGVIVTLPNFGDERAIADTLRLARLGVPILVQATPDTPSKMTITHRRDSFCGKMSACNNLMQYGIPYSLTTLHTETPDSAEFAKDLEWFAAVCRVVKGLRNLRIGALGARPTAFNTVRYSEKLLEASGISVETLDLSEVLGRISRMKDTDEAAVLKLQSIQKYVTTTDIPQAALLKMAKLGVVIDQWMKDTDLQISAVQCWTSLEENLGVVPCTVMSMMSDSLLSSACEVDVCGVLGMHALQLASETPSALLDWNNNYGNDPNKAVCFHCSNLPKHFFKDVKMDYQAIIAGTVGKENTFGTCVGQVKSGAMCFTRFSTDDTSGRIRGYTGSGRFTDDPLDTFGGAGVVEIPGLQKLLRHICENGFEHHVAANFSSVAPAVHEATTRYLGWEMYAHAG
jgi:L-fucose isomerase-like protein